MRLKAVIDRFEGDKAVLFLDDEQTAVWPRSCLPGEAREGDVLSLELNLDAKATRQAREASVELLRQLTKKEG
ncbi:MAG: DUF3006 domain-containing protein [Negativicutes bacterium]|nr:DUF3006 domain-containing protein [Negativicutes bacterium]